MISIMFPNHYKFGCTCSWQGVISTVWSYFKIWLLCWLLGKDFAATLADIIILNSVDFDVCIFLIVVEYWLELLVWLYCNLVGHLTVARSWRLIIRIRLKLVILLRYKHNITLFITGEACNLSWVNDVGANFAGDDTLLRFVETSVAAHRLEFLMYDLLCFTNSIVFTT